MKLSIDLSDVQLTQLREALDELPLWPRGGRPGYIELVAKLLPQLPLIDPVPAVQPLASRTLANGIKIDTFTPRGASMLEALDRVLGKVLP